MSIFVIILKQEEVNRYLRPYLVITNFDEYARLPIHSYALIRYAIYRICFKIWTQIMQEESRWLGYFDLTAGPGYSEVIQEELPLGKQVGGSPIIAINTEPPFDFFYFVEKEPGYYLALEKRLKKLLPRELYRIERSDVNKIIKEILKIKKGPCLVCVDPFRPTDIKPLALDNILKNDDCDLIGVWPPPESQRKLTRRLSHNVLLPFHGHSVQLAALARKIHENVAKFYERTVISFYIPQAPYYVMFALKDNKIADRTHNKFESLSLRNLIKVKKYD